MGMAYITNLINFPRRRQTMEYVTYVTKITYLIHGGRVEYFDLHYKFLKVIKNSIVITFNDLAVQTFDFQSFEPELHRDDKPSHGGK